MGRGRDCPVGIVVESFWGRSIMSFKTFLCGFIIFLIVEGFSWLMGASLTCVGEGGPEGGGGEELRKKEWRGKAKGREGERNREEEGRGTGTEKGKRNEGEDGIKVVT